MIEDVEKLLDLIDFQTAEGDAQIRRRDGDGSDAVVFKQMHAKRFRIHILDAEAHEITAVEWIDFPCVIVFRIGEDFLHLHGAVFHLGDFLGALTIEARTVKCMQNKPL